jgi:hypothetical protein
MGIRKTVFGSHLEKGCFIRLNNTWGKHYHVYHNLPFLSIIDPKTDLVKDSFETLKLSEEEFEYLKKTSIDFTICDKKDKPLMCIEFDGMQDGFNVGSKYHLRNGSMGLKERRAMFELKLRVAHFFRFPYIILGSEEFRELSDGTRLTIADALIGEVMSLRATKKRVDAGFYPSQCGYSQEDFDALSPDQQSEIIGDWLTMIEVESDFEHNPITKEIARLSKELHAYGYSIAFVNDGTHDREKWVWVECGVNNHLGAGTAKVYLPDFKTPYCYCTAHVAIEIAHFLALEQLRKKKKRYNQNRLGNRGR